MKPGFLTDPRELEAPLRLKTPGRIGVTYTGDLFNDDVPAAAIEMILGVIRKCERERPDHRFLLLTKNPKRYGEFNIPENCWCGTSVTGAGYISTDIETARLNTLLDTRYIKRWASLEPYTFGSIIPNQIFGMDWIVIGGMTGKDASPSDPRLARVIHESCTRLGISLFIKSNAGYPKKIQEYPEDLILPWERTSNKHLKNI